MSLLTLFPGRVGGSETYVRGLLDAYAAGPAPERLTLLTSRHSDAAARGFAGGPIDVHHVRSYRPGDGRATRLAAMYAARALPGLSARDVPGGLDLVHYPVTVPIPRVAGVPTIVSLLDVQHHELPGMFSAAERRFRRWAYDDAARGADVVVTITRHSAKRIVEQLGIPAERVLPIHLGVDHARFAPDGPPPSTAGLPERYLVYPANAWPHKNHERLLEAFARVGDPSLHLVLTGQAFGREAELAAHPRVRHLGHVPAGELPALYRGAVAMVFPSLFEGFGLPPLEAMACGCPVAASDAGAIAEVCDEAVVAFDARDVDAIAAAIESLAADEALRERLRRAGLERAAGFTWERTAREHLRAYELAAGAR